MIVVSEASPVVAPIRPYGGSLKAWGEMFVRNVSNDANSTQRDISDRIISCSVTCKTDDDTPWTMSVVIEGHEILQGLQEFLAPVWVTEWRDAAGNIYRVRRQLGLFTALPPRREYSRNRQENTYEGRDLIWRVAQQTARRTVKIGYGIDTGEAAMRLIGDLDPHLRIRIPKSGVITGKIRTVRPADNLLVNMNELLDAGGFWKLHSDHTGAMSTAPATSLAGAEPDRIISSELGDIFNTVTVEPDMSSFANYVYLKSTAVDAVKAAKDGYIAQSTDPNDEFSIPRIGPYSFEIADSNDITLEALKKRAQRILERKSSVYTRIQLDVVPDPRFRQYSAWRLDIKTDDRITVAAPANWRVLETTFTWGRGTSRPSQTVTLGKMASLQNVN